MSMMARSFTTLHVAALLAALSISTFVQAQEWPPHNLRILVPFPAGGSADIQARAIADELSKKLGKPVLIENKPGAGGNLAATEAARSVPDGTTLYMATTGTHAANINLYEKLSYDPVKDFQPLTLVTIYPQVITASGPYKDLDLAGLIAAIKQQGDKLNFGSSGVGSPTHLGGELFNREVGTRLMHVPYRGQGPAITDLLGGRLDVMFPSIPDALAMLQAGQMRAIAIMAEKRSKVLPDVPTTAELGYPKLLSAIWAGLYTTAGTPKPVVDRLAKDLAEIVDSPKFKDKFEAMGFEVRSSTPEQFGAYAAAETKRWGDIIKALDIKLN
ncbi:tripartite tricarboxylate transporter substrate binding protein [Tardiphaga sp. vice154]|uniref:Bug family tripartite tricarboxylate transporter substrate binding protein n=1 Tax=Tardiphaga sp. vice154 TaxID=2592814 RepID=UPI00116379AD|nr:tripartite tricarboxylate transporter substrate binding protein [Tardiphaga sp. vice154]QDM24051.1 tripartite tricarboxylate transporter substrate binding protein [Tardiphaga sp. vice154]